MPCIIAYMTSTSKERKKYRHGILSQKPKKSKIKKSDLLVRIEALENSLKRITQHVNLTEEKVETT